MNHGSFDSLETREANERIDMWRGAGEQLGDAVVEALAGVVDCIKILVGRLAHLEHERRACTYTQGVVETKERATAPRESAHQQRGHHYLDGLRCIVRRNDGGIKVHGATM